MRSKLFLLSFAATCICFGASVQAQSYAITNAKIVTVSGATIDNGTVVIRNGLIESVGPNTKAPADAEVLDGSGLTVYPGFIDALTSLGLSAPAATPARGQGGQQGADTTSNSNYPDGLRPEDTAVADLKAGEAQFAAARNAGITTVLTTGKTGIFNGQSAVINLAGDSVSAMVIKSPFAQHISFNTIRGQYPGSLLGTFSALRQMFYDAQRQQLIEKQYVANPKGLKRPDADRSLDALIAAINGQMPVVFNANSENEIVRALDLIKEFKLNGIIAGGQEAWKVAGRLKAQNIPVLLSLNFPKRTTSVSAEADPESLEVLRFRAETPKGAGKLAAAGVKFAFQSGGSTNASDFFLNAGKAVEDGLSKDAAIRAMTLGSAEILGVADRLGSIEAGKIADIAVVKGDLLGKDKFVKYVFVDGKLFENKEAPKAPAGTGGVGNGGRPASNISGIYTVNIEVPGQPLGATLNFNHQGSALTGTMVSQLGTSQISNGKVTADGFSFSTSVEFGGTTLDILVNGKVAGNQISGSVDSPQGNVPFSGTKNP